MSAVAQRTLALGALVAGAALLGASCRDLVAGDADDAWAKLCAQLEDCYPDVYDCEVGRQGFEAADPVVRDDWLAQFDPAACFATCPGAKVCADEPPSCVPTGGDCAGDAVCCGTTLGLGACGDDGICCEQDGSDCTTKDTCCSGTCVNVTPTRRTCGGVVCRLVGEGCDIPQDCCSRVCEGGKCGQIACEGQGGGCKGDEDCCDGLVCEGGACSIPPTCTPGGPCDPLVPSSCCDGELCYVLPDPGGPRCGSAVCSPLGVDCSSTSDCCEGLVCDTALAAPACRPEGSCKPVAEACDGSVPCCSGECLLGRCSAGCEPAECHDPCVVGAPIPDDPECQALPACSVPIDPFCTCVAWDESCILFVELYCDTQCG